MKGKALAWFGGGPPYIHIAIKKAWFVFKYTIHWFYYELVVD